MKKSYKQTLTNLQQYENKIHFGTKGIVEQDWIDYVEQELNFKLPESYKWMSKELEFIAFDNDYIKRIAPFELLDLTDYDILDSYKKNIKKGILNEDELSILDLDDEIYYFKIEGKLKDNEYKVYIRDYHSENDDKIYADNFLEFLENKIKEYSGREL
ncbi:MAG: SMI1/KNR4 family protein [Prevotella sp.]|jgi:hypothetical protein|nr:SMI1/KNR4 family protein [Prevotella sp.]